MQTAQVILIIINILAGCALISLSEEDTQTSGGKDEIEWYQFLKLKEENVAIEAFKRKILDTLGLEERPTIQKNLTQRNIAFIKEILGMNEQGNEEDCEKTLARMKEIIAFPTEVSTNMSDSAELSVTVKFFVEDYEAPVQRVTSAHLWIYRPLQLASRVLLYGIQANGTKRQALEIDHTKRDFPGWEQYDFMELLSGNRTKGAELTFVIECNGCSNDSIGTTDDYSPFILLQVETVNKQKLQRDKRSVKCSANGDKECCLEEYEVSFDDMGWSSKVVTPKRLKANYCRGGCIAVDLNSGQYSRTRQMSGVEESVVRLCCTPTKFSGSEIVYIDEKGNTVKEYVEDMVVEECNYT